ncbi:signal peptide peptidase SppA [Methanolobus sp. WCC5]|uniref:signal peptide peptidase SppA n=1 Tax=Methanolobus sp. WCC5 TaxID=3125785 RepID=UPI0032492224
MDNEMNGENSDKRTEDDVEYHLYPYSYEEKREEDTTTEESPGTEQDDSETPATERQEEIKDYEETYEISVKDTTEENATEMPESKTGFKAEPSESTENVQASDTAKNNTFEKKEIDEPGNEKATARGVPFTEAPATRKKGRMWQYVAVLAVVLFIIGASFAVIYQTFNGDIYSSNEKVAVIYVQGTLISSSIPGGLGYVSSEEVSDNIRRALKDKNVKAIVLRVNSGGGSSTAGEEIYTEVKKASDGGVPVIISMGDVAASAAYHLSAPADLIIANPSTMTGSIGTIWTFQNLSAYYEDEGIEFYIVKSGEFKDMGGSWRGLSEDEKEYANKVVAEIYNNFIWHVAEGRGLSITEVKELSDGRIYTGREAKELGLVDEFGNLYDAIDRAAEIGGIEGQPTIVYMNKPSISSLLFGSEAEATVSAKEFLRYYEESPYGQIT